HGALVVHVHRQRAAPLPAELGLHLLVEVARLRAVLLVADLPSGKLRTSSAIAAVASVCRPSRRCDSDSPMSPRMRSSRRSLRPMIAAGAACRGRRPRSISAIAWSNWPARYFL